MRISKQTRTGRLCPALPPAGYVNAARLFTATLFAAMLLAAAPQLGAEEPSFSGYSEAVLLGAVPTADYFNKPGSYRWGQSAAARLAAEFSPSPEVTARFAARYVYSAGYANALARYAVTGLPTDPALEDANELPGTDFHAALEIDEAWVLSRWGIADIAAGKLPVAWGSSYLANPIDRINPLGPERLLSNETPGVPAVKLDAALGWDYAVSAYLLLGGGQHSGLPRLSESRPENLPFGLLGKAYLATWEISLGLARETALESDLWQRDYRLLADAAGNAGKVGFTAGAGLRLPMNAAGTRFTGEGWNIRDALDASAGLNCLFESLDTELMLEYHHLGAGAREGSGYDLQRFLEGESLLLAEDYLFARLSRQAGTGTLTLELAALANLNDGSLLIIPAAEWAPATDLLLSAGAFIPTGGLAAEFGGRHSLAPGVAWRHWDVLSITAKLKLFF